MRESDSRVSEARTSFLPTADASYLFTPAQQAAALRIPAGIFGDDEQLFRANFIRENVLRFDVTQPIYTGGRLQYGLAATESQAASTQHQFERARQALTLEVVQAYYGALLQQQGIAVAEEGLRRAETSASAGADALRCRQRRAARCAARRGRSGECEGRAHPRAERGGHGAAGAARRDVARRSGAVVSDGFARRGDVRAWPRGADRRIAPARRREGALRRA